MKSAGFALLKIISKLCLLLEFLLAVPCFIPLCGKVPTSRGMGPLLGLLLLSVSSPLVLWAGELPLPLYISASLQEMPAPAPLA